MVNKLKLCDQIRKKLGKDNVSIGTWQQIPHALISEILGQAGYDWVAVDLEHGSICVEQLPDLFRGIELGDTLPLARLADSHPKDCKQALDAGAGGIIAPMIESAEQVKFIRDACCWPPAGTRGVGFSRANLLGKHFDEYNKEAQAPLLIAQIEHIKAVNNLEEIIRVDGIDAIMVGPYDLSASMGITAKFDNARFKKVVNDIMNICRINNIPSGYHIVEPDSAKVKKRISDGYRFIAYCTDGILLNHFSRFPL